MFAIHIKRSISILENIIHLSTKLFHFNMVQIPFKWPMCMYQVEHFHLTLMTSLVNLLVYYSPCLVNTLLSVISIFGSMNQQIQMQQNSRRWLNNSIWFNMSIYQHMLLETRSTWYQLAMTCQWPISILIILSTVTIVLFFFIYHVFPPVMSENILPLNLWY